MAEKCDRYLLAFVAFAFTYKVSDSLDLCMRIVIYIVETTSILEIFLSISLCICSKAEELSHLCMCSIFVTLLTRIFLAIDRLS